MNPDPRITTPRVEVAAPEERLDFLELLEVLWRKKWSIALWVAAFMFLGGYYAFNMTTPRYAATTVIALENNDASIVSFDSVAPELSGDFWTINTQVEILQSRKLMGKVIERLNLIEDPEFNPYLVDPNEEPGLVAKAMQGIFGKIERPPPPPLEIQREDTIDVLRFSIRATNIRNTRILLKKQCVAAQQGPPKNQP